MQLKCLKCECPLFDHKSSNNLHLWTSTTSIVFFHFQNIITKETWDNVMLINLELSGILEWFCPIVIKAGHCWRPVPLQRINATVNNQEQKRLLMDLDINMRSGSCEYTVEFYGALFREVSHALCFLKAPQNEFRWDENLTLKVSLSLCDPVCCDIL